MVAIDTFLSVGTMSARLLGPERKMPGPHLPAASAIERCRGLRSRTTPCWPRICAQSTALMETQVGALCVRMKHLAGMDKRCGDGGLHFSDATQKDICACPQFALCD
jgi:hypothetical protein